jgi:hypothetical protein
MKSLIKRLLGSGVLLTTCAAQGGQPLKVGDIWAYENRPGENASTLTILKVEQYPDLGKVVHIRVDGIRMLNPVDGQPFTDLPHLPFRASAVEHSVTRQVGTAKEIPDFNEGYQVWKTAYDAGQAGAFKTSVAQTLEDLIGGDWERTE